MIGKGGQEVDRIKEELKKLTSKDVQINIFEIKRPELDAKLVESQLHSNFKLESLTRAKQVIASVVRVGAQGIKVKCSGRLVVLNGKNRNVQRGRILCIH